MATKAGTTKFETITAPNPALNATLEEAHVMQQLAKRANISTEPRIYANGWNLFYAETDSQDNSDLPEWVRLGSPSLEAQGLPEKGPAVYLQLWIVERGNFYDVAGLWQQLAVSFPKLFELLQ